MDWLWLVTLVFIIMLAKLITDKNISTVHDQLKSQISSLQVHFEYISSNYRSQREEVSTLKTQVNKAFSAILSQQNVISSLQIRFESNFSTSKNNLEKKISALMEQIEVKSSTSHAQHGTQIYTSHDQLESQISSLETNLDKTTSDLQAQLDTISSTTLGQVEVQITALENKLNNKKTDLEAQIKTINSTTVDHLETHIATIQSTLEATTSGLQKRLTDAETVVAFTARVYPRLIGLYKNQTIQFQEVITNIKGAYNPDTGVFICPISGLYHFSVTIVSFPDKPVDTGLYVSDVLKMFTTSQGPTSDSGSTSGVFHLTAGDDVCVKVKFEYDVNIQCRYSSFSGHLIRKV